LDIIGAQIVKLGLCFHSFKVSLLGVSSTSVLEYNARCNPVFLQNEVTL